MTIGIPRALIYWKQPHFWETFFEELGFKILLSPSTNKEIVEMGVKMADPETCFSQKVYWGHLLWLEGKCDLIFVPRLKAVAEHSFISHSRFARVTEEKLEYCPKFFGLPDLGKILVKTPILTENFDERKEKFEKTLERLGKKLNKKREEAKKAVKTAFLNEKELKEKERKEKFEKTLERLGKKLNKKREEAKKAVKTAFLNEKELKEKERKDFFEKINSKKSKIVLISHPYNLYDDYVNLRIKEKLEKLGAESIFIDEVPTKEETSDKKQEIWPKFHWEFGKEIMEKIQEILKYKITGVIEISSFQCGCDAVLKEFVEKEFKTKKIPFLYLLIDEHTGEAGFQTRLEAFIDTLK